ncbi:hypothetical protein, partial [Photobacterium kishitanii]|uniref:hypothetical protein n=1 Tax=Photobacterium kishitanii TaxID=318456 RepID=UPI001C63114C
GVAPTGRAADSKSACWEFESLHPCHLQESLDSNVGAFLRLYHYDRAPTGRAAASAIPKISACWAFETCNPCHLQESLDSNVGTFLRLYHYDRAPTGRVAASAIPKISACWAFETRNPCHLQESLDSNVRIFYVCIIMIELQLAEQQLPPYRKSAPVGRLKLVTLAIFKKASTAM